MLSVGHHSRTFRLKLTAQRLEKKACRNVAMRFPGQAVLARAAALQTRSGCDRMSGRLESPKTIEE
ncbi:hypothetical protein RSSM_04160 [Rhodopirellula sallentina SM41]|uniref:Uncharacterized protein n=1 Tax=Rhodopirellula sallentina SM41 TaxID=1263870 RepID=M5TZJ1_9BACT|nr:hypothetical protein RSSM_04160 [Rhodopirellula sallentina SM41]